MPADLTIVIEGTPVPVRLGDNVDLASERAAIAVAAAEAAELARDQAADLVLPENIFIESTLAAAVTAGVSGTTPGEYFKAVGTTEGYAQVRERTADDDSVLLYEEVTKAGLASGDDDKGAAFIGFQQAGTGAVATTLLERDRRVVRAFDFYTEAQKAACLAGTDTDVSAAMQAFFDYAATLIAPYLIIDHAKHFIGDAELSLILPDNATVVQHGLIRSAASGTDSYALTIGHASALRESQVYRGLKVHRTQSDTTSGCGGIKLRNLAWAVVDIRRCVSFTHGVLCIGDGVGFVDNEIRLGLIHDNVTNLQLSATGGAGGYNNENLFIGGSFNHSSSYPDVETTNLLIDHNGTNSLNNNVFLKPNFQDNNDPSIAKAATINGQYNTIIQPRMENPVDQAAYEIEFTANSAHCSIIGRGFALAQSNITDNGTANSYDFTDGSKLSRSTPAASNKAVLKLQSTASNSARLVQFLDTSGVEAGYIDASAAGRLARVYFNEGIRWGTSSGTFTDRGLFEGSAAPEASVTASTGSLYSRRGGGIGTSFYVKVSGTGNTGWRAVGTAEDTAANIASAAATINTVDKHRTRMCWDTTNNRLMVASGANATSAWYVADGSASVTPA